MKRANEPVLSQNKYDNCPASDYIPGLSDISHMESHASKM